jgi:electron transfer flavoprotein beta subunit
MPVPVSPWEPEEKMKIAVCIKQVPETGQAKWDPVTNTMIREGVPAVINPFDLYAVEEALRIREAHGGTVAAMTMGPPQAAQALRDVIAMGVDEVYLLSDRAFAGSDTLATSRTLAAAVGRIGGIDLVICGKQATDGDTAQVGPEIAHHLGLPFIAYVRRIEEIDGAHLRAERMMEYGFDVVECPLPAVISVVKEINEPRLPSLKGKLRAKSAPVTQWTAVDLGLPGEVTGLAGSPTQVVRVFTPPPRDKGEILRGEPDEMAGALVSRLRHSKLI